MTYYLLIGTVEGYLSEALAQEEIMLDLPIGDPYYRTAHRNFEFYLDCAALVERGEKFIPLNY